MLRLQLAVRLEQMIAESTQKLSFYSKLDKSVGMWLVFTCFGCSENKEIGGKMDKYSEWTLNKSRERERRKAAKKRVSAIEVELGRITMCQYAQVMAEGRKLVGLYMEVSYNE